jgi:hypothetical protein
VYSCVASVETHGPAVLEILTMARPTVGLLVCSRRFKYTLHIAI